MVVNHVVQICFQIHSCVVGRPPFLSSCWQRLLVPHHVSLSIGCLHGIWLHSEWLIDPKGCLRSHILSQPWLERMLQEIPRRVTAKIAGREVKWPRMLLIQQLIYYILSRTRTHCLVSSEIMEFGHGVQNSTQEMENNDMYTGMTKRVVLRSSMREKGGTKVN